MSAAPTVDLVDLVDQLAAVHARWLPPTLGHSVSLSDALSSGVSLWPAPWDDTERSGSRLLFPFPYAGQPRVSPALFHQLVDAACEARRAGTEVVVVAVPTARSGPRRDAAEAVSAIAHLFRDGGFPVVDAGDVSDLADVGRSLVASVCASPLTRRHVDLTDVLVDAAAAALRCDWVYRTDGVAVGKQLGSRRLCPPHCRLYDRGDPFAAPPAGSKRPPAGSDAVLAAAMTLGLDGRATPPEDRAAIQQPVAERLAPLWRNLQRRRLCGGSGHPTGSALSLRVGDRRPVEPIAVPLFGAPVVSAGTRAFVGAAAMLGRLELIVDDLTPRLCYAAYPVDVVRAAYRELGVVRFVSEVPGLAERLDEALRTLTVGQLDAASANRRGRRRGGLTGYDAIHLAVMALACAQSPATVAVRSPNVAGVHAMAPVFEPQSLVTVTGDNPDTIRWRADLPARHLAQEEPSHAR